MANGIDIKPNGLRAWVLASRPKTLGGALTPVAVAAALVWRDTGRLGALPLALCALFALLMQVAANFVNDYFDFLRGRDGADRLGPLRACAQGWVTPGAMRRAIAVACVAACAVGMPLVGYGGWAMLAVGAVCVAFCFLYTLALSGRGLGDVLVLLFFGLVPAGFTYYVQTRAWTLDLTLVSLACGLVVDTLLVVNNFRDREQDLRNGKRTLLAFLPAGAGRALYLWLGLGAAALCLPVVWGGGGLWCGAPLALFVAAHLAAWRSLVRAGQGRALNAVLGSCGRNILVFGVLLSISLALA